jgi:hypothetical protein
VFFRQKWLANPEKVEFQLNNVRFQMKTLAKILIVAALLPVIIIGAWIGGDYIAGTVFGIPPRNKVYFMATVTTICMSLFVTITPKLLQLNAKAMFAAGMLGVGLTIGCFVLALRTVLANIN